MKENFCSHSFSEKSERLLDSCQEILEDSAGVGIRLTLRQLYYRLVARNMIPNVSHSYKQLERLMTNARMSGRVDWEMMEDRNRILQAPSEFSGLQELAQAAVESYRLDRWEGQQHYVELWAEKDALSSVLLPVADELHIRFMAARGYSSVQALYEAKVRFIEQHSSGKICKLLYIGDHDASGQDMPRYIQQRMNLMGATVEVKTIALTTEQVREYNPPPNPAKETDSRAAGYISRHGPTSWEADALEPEVLQGIARESILKYLDYSRMERIIRKETLDRKRFIKAVMD